jgi:hypothetical protein
MATGSPVGQSDVRNKVALEKYRTLRAKWLEWLQTDPNHSIWSQIFAMISNDLAVRTIACAAENDPDSPLHNRLLAQTIIDGHRDAQILGIRRLMDDDYISLGRLLKELKRNMDVFTREIYISGGGQPYDSDSVTSIASVHGPGYVSSSSAVGRFFLAEREHERFDRLSRVRGRMPADCIPKSLIDQLKVHITNSGADEVVKWSHQFVAHAGDAQARGWRNLQITFEQVASAQKSIVQVAQFISAQLLQGPGLGTLVPVEYKPFDRFERLVNPRALAKARELRDDLERDRNSWLQNNWGDPDLLTVVGWPDAPCQ